MQKLICIEMLNVQGLTEEKTVELLELVKPGVILCLTETQKKVDAIKRGEEVEVVQSMREMQDRRGGGLMCAVRRRDMKIEKRKTKHRDLLHVGVEILELDLSLELIITYWRTGNEIEVANYNEVIAREMGEIIRRAENEEKKLMVLGDFNGHLGYIGYQEENRNGKIINDFICRHDLILLNTDEMCKGTYTWERGENRSVIDLVLVNRETYNRVDSMEVDEEREEVDFSDHCMIKVWVKGNKQRREKNDKKWVEKKHYKFSEERVETYKEQVERKVLQLEEKEIAKINGIVLQAAEENLTVKYRKKTKEEEEEKPWMTEEIRKAIGERRNRNKEHRNLREEEEREEAWTRYVRQKMKVKEMIREQMREYEKKITEEIQAEGRGRKLWDHINKLKGKRNTCKGLVLHNEENKPMEPEHMEREIGEYWKNIYGMHENKIGEVWTQQIREEYEENLQRIREQQQEEERREEGRPRLPRIILNPYSKIGPMNLKIEKEDVRKAVRKMKNKKAGGNDGVKPEMF